MTKEVSDQLTDLLRNLNVHWGELQTIWDDPVRREFEQLYIDPLRGKLDGIRAVIDDLENAVRHARTVVEDR